MSSLVLSTKLYVGTAIVRVLDKAILALTGEAPPPFVIEPAVPQSPRAPLSFRLLMSKGLGILAYAYRVDLAVSDAIMLFPLRINGLSQILVDLYPESFCERNGVVVTYNRAPLASEGSYAAPQPAQDATSVAQPHYSNPRVQAEFDALFRECRRRIDAAEITRGRMIERYWVAERIERTALEEIQEGNRTGLMTIGMTSYEVHAGNCDIARMEASIAQDEYDAVVADCLSHIRDFQARHILG